MNIKIRSEKISDYSSIAIVNYEAFMGLNTCKQYVSEPVMVDLLRNNLLFDPELSLVAEVEGRVAGHALFSPFRFIVSGNVQPGVMLAPLAVKPEFQNKGIGSALVEEGHRIAKEKGFTLSLLCGHDNYYPRFGYKTRMFSLTGIKAYVCFKDFDGEGISERAVRECDIDWITEAWNKGHSSDSLAIFPGKNISDWSSYSKRSRCSVITKDGKVLGYVRVADSDIPDVRELLADSENIPDILAYVAWKKYGRAEGEIKVAGTAEKFSSIVSENLTVADDIAAYSAYMIKVLDDNSPVVEYCDGVEKGIIKPGVISFHPVFDLDD
ncbi:MAG: GNAT family N-acetyltransferase [Clostridiaceae bacterium]|nr:GNAT family N-acetyltransferase [Clostridiaceae bacterium]